MTMTYSDFSFYANQRQNIKEVMQQECLLQPKSHAVSEFFAAD